MKNCKQIVTYFGTREAGIFNGMLNTAKTPEEFAKAKAFLTAYVHSSTAHGIQVLKDAVRELDGRISAKFTVSEHKGEKLMDSFKKEEHPKVAEKKPEPEKEPVLDKKRKPKETDKDKIEIAKELDKMTEFRDKSGVHKGVHTDAVHSVSSEEEKPKPKRRARKKKPTDENSN